jgi:hypothetical protein
MALETDTGSEDRVREDASQVRPKACSTVARAARRGRLRAMDEHIQ